MSSTMPAQSGDPISAALHSSLTTMKKCRGEDVDTRIYASTKQILFSDIKYEKSKCFNSSLLSELKSKYIVLNTVVQTSTKSDEVTSSSKDLNISVNSDVARKKVVPPHSKEPISLPTPKRVLYSPDNVRLGWSGQVPVGAGFVNLGNTCYLNSSLQALFHVPAFVNWLLADTNHSSKCESMNGTTHSECLICAMSKTLQASQSCTGSVIKPFQIYAKLKLICKHLVHGHQEDAHEFLRYLIEGMERSYLSIFNGIKLDSYSKETTPLNQIFGGYLRSEVTCLECQHVSTTFQHFQDLLLDIRTASSVDDALESYFSRERLGDGDQAYRCEQCKRRVAATKKFTIERPPKALCIALKRFGAMGGKNSKNISLKQILDVSKYRHRPSPTPLHYKLVAMVTHLGPSSSSGHYTAVGQAATGTYYHFDDTLVRPLALQHVLSSNPYILMYEMDTEVKKQPHTPKKEVTSNGFQNSNGHSNSTNIEVKPNTPNGSTSNVASNSPTPSCSSSSSSSSASSSTSSSSELKPGQNGKKPFKVFYLGRPRTDGNQPGPSKPSSSTNSPQQNKSNFSKMPPLQKDSSPRGSMDRESLSPQKGSEDNSDLSFASAEKSQEDIQSPEKSSTSYRENSLSKIPLPNTPEKLVSSTTEDDRKGSPSMSLVPYSLESSESEGEFVPPKPSIAKESPKLHVKTSDRASPNLHKAKGVRIEIEGWETSQVGSNRLDLHSPAGSTSSGKWSVTSAERDRTPEKAEKPSSSTSVSVERLDRVPNGPSTSSNSKVERWDNRNDSRNDNRNSAVDHLMTTSHRGYGGQVKSWNGSRSEMDMQVEGERNYLKRSHDSYNDEFDRGKVKKVKKYHKDGNINRRNRFQDFQNRKNMWQGNQRQKFYRDYVNDNRPKQHYYNMPGRNQRGFY